jgi:hypothetical protein
MSTGFHVQLFTDDRGVGWRLLSGNNRECGRGATSFDDGDECVDVVRGLQRDVELLVHRTRISDTHRWRWEVLTHERSVAATSRSFDRLIRCEQGAQAFLSSFAAAPIRPTVISPVPRRGTRIA